MYLSFYQIITIKYEKLDEQGGCSTYDSTNEISHQNNEVRKLYQIYVVYVTHSI